MRKSILAMFVVLIALFAVACGGNKPANGGNSTTGGGCTPAAEDMMAFYKKAGNYYVMKTTSKVAGNESVSGVKIEITKSDDKGYTMKTTVLDKDLKPMDGVKPTEATVEWPKPVEPAKDAKPVEMKKEKVTVAGKDLECVMTEVAGTKSWSYKGMPVKSETKNDQMESKSEVVEFKCE